MKPKSSAAETDILAIHHATMDLIWLKAIIYFMKTLQNTATTISTDASNAKRFIESETISKANKNLK